MLNHPRVVLVVEESDVAHKLLTKKLAPEGFFVRHAEHWVRALKFAQEIPPRIVVLDYSMPHLEPDLFIDHIHALRSRPEIVLIGNNDDEKFSEKIAHHGVNYFLRKPLNIDLLLSIIRSFSVWMPHYARLAGVAQTKRVGGPTSFGFAAGQ